MSRIRAVQVFCINCKAGFQCGLWQSINSDYPELVESFLKGTLNFAKCPACSMSFFVPIPVLYNDMQHGLMIQIDEAEIAASNLSRSRSDSGIEGVRHRRRPNRPTQLISANSFAISRAAVRRLDDAATLDSIRQAHPEWPPSVIYAQAFICHYKRELDKR